MKCTIDVTPWMKSPSGIGFYVSNLVRSLHHLSEQTDFDLQLSYQPRLGDWCTGNLAAPEYLEPRSHVKVFPFPVRFTNSLIDFPQLFSPQIERSFGSPDIFHGTNYTVFPFRKSRKVLTIYDLTFVHYPQYANSTVRAYRDRVKKCLEWTDLVLAISHNSKQDVIEQFGVDPDRIQVTHLASRYQIDQSVPELEFAKPYILFVSTIEPRKNIKSLISAFERLKENHKIEHDLILIGQKGWLYEPIFEKIARSPYQSSIHYLSYLPDEKVAQFYRNSDVFVYPSHYEGFGMPVLEAMTLGAPVVTSNTSSLPEIAGDAALFVEPKEVEQLSEMILKVIENRELRDRLIQKGKEQAKLYSWEKTAKETLNAYRSIL